MYSLIKYLKLSNQQIDWHYPKQTFIFKKVHLKINGPFRNRHANGWCHNHEHIKMSQMFISRGYSIFSNLGGSHCSGLHIVFKVQYQLHVKQSQNFLYILLTKLGNILTHQHEVWNILIVMSPHWEIITYMHVFLNLVIVKVTDWLPIRSGHSLSSYKATQKPSHDKYQCKENKCTMKH